MDAADGHLTIRPFEPADLTLLHEIRGRAFAPVFSSFRDIVGDSIARVALAEDEAEQGQHLDELCAGAADSCVFVAESRGTIVGFATVVLHREKRIGEIGLNAVDPDHSGKGIGSSLYEFALERMREAGMKVAMVGTGGDESHAPARRAYAKVGLERGIPSVWLYREL